MTSQQLLVCDSSTLANFSSWASAISAFFAASTWAQTADTGQVMWSGMSLSAVSVAGSSATYTYSSLTGLALAVGRALTITGMTHSQNNGTFVITSLGSGTFTVTNASAIAESGSVGVVTQISSPPGTSASVYEIWQPNDGLTPFYIKITYGNDGAASAPAITITMGSSTSGTGTLTGVTTITLNSNNVTSLGATIPFICNFSGAAGRIGIMLWQNSSNNAVPLFFAFERSISSTGAYTSSYATMWMCGQSNSNFNGAIQVSLIMGVTSFPPTLNGSNCSNDSSWCVRVVYKNGGITNSVNGKLPIDQCAPTVGYIDYPCTVCGAVGGQDVTEGSLITTTLYGNTRTYLLSKVTSFSKVGNNNNNSTTGEAALAMRFD